MSVIEGVGDEVTVVCTIFLLLCIVLLAWFSTHTRDIPFVSIIVVELSQRRNRNGNSAESEERPSVQPAQDDSGESGSGAGNSVASDSGGGDTGTPSGGNAGFNNNAQTSDEETIPATTSQNQSQFVSAHSNDSNQKVDTHSADPPDISNSDTAAQSTSLGLTENLPGDSALTDIAQTSSQAPILSTTNLQSGLSQEPEEVAAIDIPSFTSDTGSSDEVRRRRLAYFESTKDKNTDTYSVGAESEKSCLDAQSTSSEAGPSVANRSGQLPGEGTQQPESASTSYRPSSSAGGVHLQDSESSSYSGGSATAVHGEDSQLSAAGGSPSDVAASASSGVAGSPAGVATSSDPGRSAEREQNEARIGGSAENDDADVQQIRVRLKYLNDTQRLVYANPQETVGNFRRLHFSEELEDNKIVRFIFNGQDLRNDLSTLRAYNIADNSVVHCLITQNRQNEPDASARRNAEDDEAQMGAFIYPVFGLILGLVWYARFTYKQYFNAMSTVSLAGVSFIFVLALFSSFRNRRQQHQHLD